MTTLLCTYFLHLRPKIVWSCGSKLWYEDHWCCFCFLAWYSRSNKDLFWTKCHPNTRHHWKIQYIYPFSPYCNPLSGLEFSNLSSNHTIVSPDQVFNNRHDPQLHHHLLHHLLHPSSRSHFLLLRQAPAKTA